MRIPTLFLLMVLQLTVAHYCEAQEATGDTQIWPTGERLRQVEKTLQKVETPKGIEVLRKAQLELKSILETDRSSVFKSQVETNLDLVNEHLALHDLLIAAFYMSKGHGHSLIGARSRLQGIIQNYPKFSKMDEVLFRLSVISIANEEPEEAARYSWKLICNYPNSEYTRAAFDQLNTIGVSSWEGCEKYKR
jgi:outer membrane protein assembly factor BamD (BamD/ComL family)